LNFKGLFKKNTPKLPRNLHDSPTTGPSMCVTNLQD